MTAFQVNPGTLDQHATQVDAIAADVGNGAAAEVTGTSQADFGVLIGNTLGFGIRALAQSCERSLQAAQKALAATGGQLHSDASVYADAEAANHTTISRTGKAL